MPDRADDDLVRLAADLLGAEQGEVFISIDGRTVPGSRVRREVRALLEGRLLEAALRAADAGEPGEAAELDVPLAEVTERVLTWGSVVLSEDAAARLVGDLAAEGWVRVVGREERAVRVARGPGPASSPGPGAEP